ncbi:hypothetical protein BH09BAC6_BH09BAC6_28920 [soil metagenome]
MLHYTDYLITISPPDDIIKMVTKYKRASVNVIGHFEGMYTTPQIIVTHQKRCKPSLVQPVIIQWQQKLKTMPTVTLRISGFGFFENGPLVKTIYAKIETTPHTLNWFKLLMQQLGIKLKNFVPHIPVAGNIPVTAFDKLWPHLAADGYSYSFKVNSLTILHKETFAEHNEWRVYRELFFENKLAII